MMTSHYFRRLQGVAVLKEYVVYDPALMTEGVGW